LVGATLKQTFLMHFWDVYYIVQRRGFALMLMLALAGLLARTLKPPKEGVFSRGFLQLAFGMAAVYTAAALIPLPTFAQYLDGPLLPFLIFFMVEGLRVCLSSRARWICAAVLVFLV